MLNTLSLNNLMILKLISTYITEDCDNFFKMIIFIYLDGNNDIDLEDDSSEQEISEIE